MQRETLETQSLWHPARGQRWGVGKPRGGVCDGARWDAWEGLQLLGLVLTPALPQLTQ